MMAIVKKTQQQLRQERKRTTWTRFHLPRGQDWPKWSATYSNTYLGPLADVAGCMKVRLGRKVEDPEQAVLIVRKCVLDHIGLTLWLTCSETVWESVDALNDFQQSPACSEFIRGLGSEDKSPSQLLSLQWDGGFCLGDELRRGDDLHGRITLTILTIPYTGVADRKSWRRVLLEAFGAFLPMGCAHLHPPPPFRWMAYTWIDNYQQTQPTGVETGRKQAVCYLFFRWNGNGASPQLEEASVGAPGAYELWAATVAKATPPVESWGQERWDIEVAPCHLEPDSGDDEEDQGSAWE
ncbi:hypothetical protein CIB48_g3931 [Xylaria polymorpha]|nr:hypothetical protein CIB48_g3931 [Xylaria polymorpha]